VRAHTQSPWLHEEVARRMAQRLEAIRLPVQCWAHWEPVRGGLAGHDLVAAHYPDAQVFHVCAQAQNALPAIEKPWWWRFKPARQPAPATVAAPPDGALQLVWANMIAHQAADPAALLADWRRALAENGFVMFSCLGPDTLCELRALYAEQGWPSPAQEFADMRDWGSQLLAAGFADPVMDTERITLTFETPARLLAELRELGRNLHSARHAALRTPRWRRRLEAGLDQHLRPPSGGPLQLTFEILYGHALKAGPHRAVAGSTSIPLHEVRAQLRQRSKS
jgi:malonyl-CoA O-methyltransferase